MNGKSTLRILLSVLTIVLSLFVSSTAALAADGGEISAYFGTDTTYTPLSGDSDTATASGNGVGGTVAYGGNNLTNGTNPGYTTASNREWDVVVTPDPGYQIVWIKRWRRGNEWKDEDVESPRTGATNFERKVEDGRKYWIAVKFESTSVNYKVSYTIAADNPAGTNCNTTATVNPNGFQTVFANATASFVITNSNASCSLESVKFDTGGFTTTGIVGNVYTTPPITKNVDIQIRYRGSGYTITSSIDATGASNCGLISPGTQGYAAGSNQIFTITKNSGCAIDSVLVDGAAVTAAVISASNTHTFNNIQANHTIVVKYVTTVTTQGAAYCQVPPFIANNTALKPNVLIIFDTSGSMGGNPYSGMTYDCTATGAKSTLASCRNYYGSFDKTKMYKIGASSSEYLIDTAATFDLSSSNALSGNYLNFKNMQKVDIIRQILVGGQVATGGSYSARGSAVGGTNKRFLLTESGKKIEYGTTDPTGVIHSAYDKVRFGLMAFNQNSGDKGSDDGGYIVAPLGATKDALVSAIENNNTDPGGYTPLAESLYEATRYYRGTTSAYNSGVNYGNTTSFPVTSPFSRHAIQANCQKHFVLVLTDGEPTNDGNIPSNGTNTNITDTSFSTWWTTASAAALKPTTLMGRVAYYAHSHNLLDLTQTPTDLSTISNLNVYTVFTFDNSTTGITTLKEAAKFGSFVEGSTPFNAKPDLVSEWSSDSGVTTNNYYQADNGDVLAENITDALSKMIDSTASGTAAAVANNKSGERGANMIQALFYPQWPEDSKIKWLGEVQAMWFYLSPTMQNTAIYEDSDGNKELNPMLDKIPPSDTFKTKALWRAGAQLQKMSPANRNIYTLLDGNSVLTAAANKFTTANVTTLKQATMMNVASFTDTAASTLIDYIRGTDNSIYRSRKVIFKDPYSGAPTDDVWKLGDIIDSTPQIQSSIAINGYDLYYNDTTYSKFFKSNQYKARNMVYTGSNDGMLHAFRLGVVTNINDVSNKARIAQMTGQVAGNTDLGQEDWAYIPKNALPYLQNQAGTEYCHQYLVDGAPTVADVAIFKADNTDTDCSDTKYWNCTRKTTVSSAGVLDAARTTWGTVLVGSMGLGGASRDSASSCNETLNHDASAANNVDCVKTPVSGNGLSSYFALNVTDPAVPKYMWEFSDYSIADAADKGLGFTTPGTAIVRINSVAVTGAPRPDKAKNGRWFAVFASGPTGAIQSSTFTGRSDQNLKLYIVDLNGGSTFTKCSSAGQTGCNYWVKDTGIKYAFANSLSGATIDLNRWNSYLDGNYSDDVVYITYTKASLDGSGFPVNTRSSAGGYDTPTPWEKGGVLRLVTNHNPDPYTWFTSKLIDDTGPITTSIGRLQDRQGNSLNRTNEKGNLWIYFGEGRFYHPGDELAPRRNFYGVSDPCYKQYLDTTSTYSQYTGDDYKQYAMGTSEDKCGAVTLSDLENQTSSISVSATNTLNTGKKGWYVSMAPASTGSTAAETGAERVLTDVRADLNGVVYFTTFTPNTDVCVPGGTTSMWAVNYNTGGAASKAALVGKTPVQTSGSGITLVDMKDAFTKELDRKLDPEKPVTVRETDSETTTTSTLGNLLGGMASKDRGAGITSNTARKKILHSQER